MTKSGVRSLNFGGLYQVQGSLSKVSKLFNHKDGERFVNVAFSRARHKLIVVGDTNRFMVGHGIATVSNNVSKALYNIHDVSI